MNQQTYDLPMLSLSLIDNLNKSNISYCHWKSNEHLWEGLSGKTDLDLLVGKNSKSQFTTIITNLGFKKVVNSNLNLSYTAVEDWIGFCEETGILLHLHVHFELITGTKFVKEYSLPWTKYVLDTAVVNKEYGIKVTNPHIELILLIIRLAIKAKYNTLFKSLIKRKNPYSKDMQKELDYLIDNIDSTKTHDFIIKMFPESSNLVSEVESLVLKSKMNSQDIFRLKKIIYKELATNRKYNNFTILNKYLSGLFLMRLGAIKERLGFNVVRRKKFESGGIIITFIGSDGAGKTTMINNISNWLRWKIDVHGLYLGSGDNVKNPVLKKINRLIKKTDKGPKSYSSKDKKTVATQSNTKNNFSLKLFLKTKLFMLIAKDKQKSIKRAIKLKLGGSVVITDRYPQIQFLGQNDAPYIREHVLKYNSNKYFETSALKEESKYKKMVRCSPDIVIKLIVSPEVAVKRKPEHSFEQIEKKVRIISALQFSESSVYEVDASQNIDKVALDIRRIIWKNL